MGGTACLTVGALGFEVPASFAEGLPKAGAVAPSFDLPSNRGKNFSNKDLLGKWAVIPLLLTHTPLKFFERPGSDFAMEPSLLAGLHLIR